MDITIPGLARRFLIGIAVVFGLLVFTGCSSGAQTTTVPATEPIEIGAENTTTPENTATPVEEPEIPPATEPAAPTPTLEPTAVTEAPPTVTPTEVVVSCEPTPPDALGPFYVPNAPERASVGEGHLLDGVVRSSGDCTVIPNAQLEFWLAGPTGDYGDAYRATLFADENGAYAFESDFPPPYSGRPSHIHMRVSADGYETLVTQYYPAAGQTSGTFDLVLVPTSASDQSETEGAPDTGVARAPVPTLFDIEWNDRSVFESGLIEGERGVLDQLPGASIYHLDVEIADDLTHLQGRQEVLYTNREEVPLDEIYFRLFPNLTGGSTTISALTVNGESVEPSYELENSAMRIPLSPGLAPGEQAVIRMEFSVELPNAEGGNYGTFAFLDEVLALAHFYPLIPVYDDEGWNVEVAPRIGDVVYADSSFYLVRITAPAQVTLVGSGLEIEHESQDDRQTVIFAAGPVRDFYLAASERYTVASRSVGQTTINSYAPAELIEGAEVALNNAGQALERFNERFGPYPFTELDLVSTTTFALGVEYPGIVAILIDLYEQSENQGGIPTGALLESVVAHEVAHQWFYSTVGNDQVDEPWVDEALVQYATLLYYADIYGPPGAAGFRSSLERRWDRVSREDIPIGLPVREYSPQEYGAIVYGRGPLFVETLAETLGEETFAAFLRDYYQTHQWGIASGNDLKELAEQHCACDLTALFQTWVYEEDTVNATQ